MIYRILQTFFCEYKTLTCYVFFEERVFATNWVSLYGHGFLHFAELGFAIYEEAYITASLAGFGALSMILGAIFLGKAHHH